MVRIGSLFSGIGGFELGLERAIPQAQTIWQVEQDEFCQRILQKHWPSATIYDDVKNINKHNVAPIDILCGGFPCQDISIAGQGKGIIKDETRSGLFWEMHRIINELRPRVAVLENVPAITFRGGLEVLGSLAQIGYDAEWVVISAREFGAPHKRERWFCVAYPVGIRCNGRKNPKQQDTDSIHQEWHTEKGEQQWSERVSWPNENTTVAYPNNDRKAIKKKERASDIIGTKKPTTIHTHNQEWIESTIFDNRCHNIPPNVAYPNGQRLEKKDAKCMRFESERKGIQSVFISTTNNRSTTYTTGRGYWKTSHPEPLICRVDDGFSRRLDNPRLKALGNAIVPQCSEWIGEQIVKSGLLDNIL